MKSLKIVFASWLLLAITTLLSTTNASAQTNVSKEIEWTGANQSNNDFITATGDKTWLNDIGNWTGFQPTGTKNCGIAGTKLCKVVVTYTYTGTDPAPTVQEVIDELRLNYDDSGTPHFFINNPYSFVKLGIPINCTIVSKS